MIDRPSTVDNALRVVAAISVLSGVIALLTWVFRTDLVLAWAEGNAGARELLREGGIEAVEASLTVPGFVPVVVTSFVVLLMLLGVLAVFFREGFTWARICLAVIAVFGAFLAVLSIASGIPTLFEVLSGIAVVLCLVLLALLLHPSTGRYCRET